MTLVTEISKRSFYGVLQFLFAPDVSLRCLDGGVPKQKPNLFEFAAAIVAESGAGTTKVMGCQVGYASLPGTSRRLQNAVKILRAQRLLAQSA